MVVGGCCAAWVCTSCRSPACLPRPRHPLCRAHLRYCHPFNGTLNSVYIPSSNHVRPRPRQVSQSLCHLHGCSSFRLALVRRSHTLPTHASLVLPNDSSRISGEGWPAALPVVCLQTLGSFSAVEYPPGIPPIHADPPGKAFPGGWKRRRPLSKAPPNAPFCQLATTDRTAVSTSS